MQHAERSSAVELRGPRVGCVILAAGEGRRFGGNKLIALYKGRPLVQRAIDAAGMSQALTCTLVIGADAEALLSAVDSRRCAIVSNPEWREGIASSIRAGLHRHESDDACVLLVGDEPLVAGADIDALIASFADHPKSISALRAGRVWGTPVLFPRPDLKALARLRGDSGAKRYAQTQKKRLRLIDAANPRAFADVDTRADLARLNR